ncbi:Hypothetical predicted protein [Olea europaea subsp. europaea]|nr:Hypothetical predicted protein [Olea europaea subsp. europaea]
MRLIEPRQRLNLEKLRRVASKWTITAVDGTATIHTAKRVPVAMTLIEPRQRLNLEKLRVLIASPRNPNQSTANIGHTVINFLLVSGDTTLNIVKASKRLLYVFCVFQAIRHLLPWCVN